MPSASTAASAHCRHCSALARACFGILGAARGRSFLRLPLVLLCALTKLVGPGLRLGIDAAARRVAHLLLDRAQPPLQIGAAFPRNLADLVPFVADVPQRRARGVQVGGVEPLGLREQLFLGVRVGAELRVALGGDGVARGEEGVLGGLEPLP